MNHLKTIVLLLIVGCSVVACGSTTNTGSSITPANTTVPIAAVPTATPTPVGHFKVGQVVAVGGLYQVTVNGVKTATSQPYIQPAAGNIYLLLDVSVKNVGSSEQTLSLLNYTFRDGAGVKYSQVYINANNSPWGKVEPGQLVRGQLAYEIPKSQKSFELSFESDVTQPGETIWDITV